MVQSIFVKLQVRNIISLWFELKPTTFVEVASKRDKIVNMHVKYVAQAICLKTDLETDNSKIWPKPPMKRERFEQSLPQEKTDYRNTWMM